MPNDITNLQPVDAVYAIDKQEIDEITLYNSIRAAVFNNKRMELTSWFSEFIDILLGKISSRDNKSQFYLDIASFSNSKLAGSQQYVNNLTLLNNFLNELDFSGVSTKEGAFAGGLIKYAMSDFAAAENYFQKYSSLTQGKPLFHRTAAPFYRNPLKHSLSDKCISSQFQLKKKSVAKAQEVVLVTCDSGYLKAYGEDFFNNLIALDKNCSVHIHIINPVKNLYEKINFLNHPNIGVSFEISAYHQVGTYSALSRYLIAEKIIDEYNKNIVIADIDLFFRISPSKIVSVVNDDFGIYVNNEQGRCFPWTYALAGIGVYKHAQSSVEFLKTIARFNSNMYDDSINCWMLDQLALDFSLNRYSLPFTDLNNKGLPLVQFSDRAKRRAIAKKFLIECGIQ